MHQLEAAIRLATKAHSGQLDKAGMPYILHPLRVMMRVAREKAPEHCTVEDLMVIAVLHDTVEDTTISLNDIRERFGLAVTGAVDALTKRGYENYSDLIRRSKAHPLARIVKMADLRDNLDDERLRLLPSNVRQKLRTKYWKALDMLVFSSV